MNKISKIILSLFFASLSLAIKVQAAEPIAAAWMDLTSVAKVESGTGERAGVKQFGVYAPIEKRIKRTESFVSQFNIKATNIDWRGVAMTDEFFWLSLPIEYQQKRANGYNLIFNFEPGFMTDFATLSERHLGLNFQAKIRKPFTRSKHSYWQLGLMSDRRFGDYDLRPVAALAWRATPSTKFVLGFPETRMDVQVAKTVNTYLRVAPEGGVWRYQVKGQNEDSDASYRSVRTGLGLNFHWRAKAWVGAEIGQVRNSVLEATNNANAKVKAFLDDDKYWRIYADIRF